ncbi:MAG TPA: four helix bundle protein [Gemmatimonadaceae bacterium]|jgi:four helix bundle protein
MINDPEYERWLRTVPAEITQDTLWRMTAYRYALYAMSRAQADVPFFEQCRATRPHVDQLLRAVGAISANLEEGYGRSGAADRAHFYEYALSTAREARGWYYKCALALPAETLASRLSVFTQIIRILTKTVPEVRASKTRWRPRRESDDKPLSEPNE